MKKFILLFLVIMCSFYFVIDGYVMEAHATEEIDLVYEQPEHSELIHYSDELAEDYVLFFTYNDEEYTFSLLDYYFCNNKNNRYSGIADVYTNFNNSNKEFFVAKLSYISTGINRYIIKCHVYFSNINKMVYFQVLTNYYLSEVLEFYETYDYNDIVMKNASVFNYCKSQLATSKTRSVSNVESVIAEYSKETFLSTSEFLYEYIPLHSDSTSGIGGYVGDDSIVNVIPKEYFLTAGVKFKYGREWGFYLNVESISSDQKECSLITFQIKMEKPTNQSYISIEFIPLFQQEYTVLTDSENNRIWFDNLFYGSYKGSYVVSEDYAPGYAFSDFSLNSYFTNLETFNKDEEGYVFEEDNSPRVDSVTCGVLNYRSSHDGINSASSSDQAVVGHYLNAITDLAWSETVAYFGSTVKVLELADYVMNHIENLVDFVEKTTIVETLSSQYNVYSYDSLNQNGLVSSYVRDISIKFSTNGEKKIYIGESWDDELSDSMERFSTNIHIIGQGAQKSFHTIAINLNNFVNYRYSAFKTLVFSNELVYDLVNTDYFGYIDSYQSISSTKPDEVISFVPTRSGMHEISYEGGASSAYYIFDSSFGKLNSGMISQLNNKSMTYLESGKLYYLYFSSYSNSNFNTSFSLNYYNSNVTTYNGVNLNKNVETYGYWIINISVTEFKYYNFTTLGTADTKIYIFKDDYLIDYNDDYYETSDDEDANLNAYCYNKLVIDNYYVLIYNNGSYDNITFSTY